MSKIHSASILPLALAAAFAAPAFAQDAATTQSEQAPPAAQAQTSSDASASAAETDSGKKSWSDLDANKNGTLSTSEAAAMQSLAKIFAQADADGNGELAPEEYKSWLAANGDKEAPKSKP